MIQFLELCPYDVRVLTVEQKAYLDRLFWVTNVLRIAYSAPLIVTSPIRSREDHQRIYEEKNKRRREEGLEPISIPWDSMHLRGAAVDFYDPVQRLQRFLLSEKGLELSERLDLYFEEFSYTPNWVHVQILPPKSLRRFFIPY